MIIGIVGSRRRDTLADFLLVEKAFRLIYQPGDRIVSGGCPQGGDRFAELIAIQLANPGHYTNDQLMAIKLIERHQIIKKSGAPIHIHHAEWHKRGNGAGFYRNTFIARDSDKLIACVAADRTGGTEDSITKYRKRLGLTEEEAISKGDLILV